MLLVVGLGNPGKEYTKTRHNVGFCIIDRICKAYSTALTNMPKLCCKIATISIKSIKVILVQPTTYMNLSGSAVARICGYYKIKDPSQIIVIHDDIDLTLGDMRIKQGGGSGGHNGLKSIDAHVGQNYWRIRCGVGRPEHQDAADFVLSNFTASESAALEKVMETIADNFDLAIEHNWEELKKKLR